MHTPHTHTPFLRSLLAATAAAVCFVVGGGCVTTPSEQDRKLAEGHVQVAAALVQEADSAATTGDAQAQDLKYRDALRELLEAEKTGAIDAQGDYLLAAVYFLGFRRHEEAIAHAQRAMDKRQKETQEEYPEAENLMGAILVDAGRPRDALPWFEKARTNLLYSTPYFAEMEMGWALFKLGRHDEAVSHLERALVAQPDLLGAYVKLAEVQIARGDDARAQRALADLLARCDSERLKATCGPRLLAPAFYQLGMSRLRTGERDRAAEALRTCTSRFPDDPTAAECDRSLKALE